MKEGGKAGCEFCHVPSSTAKRLLCLQMREDRLIDNDYHSQLHVEGHLFLEALHDRLIPMEYVVLAFKCVSRSSRDGVCIR